MLPPPINAAVSATLQHQDQAGPRHPAACASMACALHIEMRSPGSAGFARQFAMSLDTAREKTAPTRDERKSS